MPAIVSGKYDYPDANISTPKIMLLCICFYRDEKEIMREFDQFWEPSKSSVSRALIYKIYVNNSRSGEYTVSPSSMSKYESFIQSL